jgi:hypothetical protein
VTYPSRTTPQLISLLSSQKLKERVQQLEKQNRELKRSVFELNMRWVGVAWLHTCVCVCVCLSVCLSVCVSRSHDFPVVVLNAVGSHHVDDTVKSACWFHLRCGVYLATSG